MLNKKLVFLVVGLVVSIQSFSQCAMCKAAVEANLEAGGTKGAGLNDGILYLMAMPYIAVVAFGFFWYLQNKKQTT
ncbi:MAG: hypothetical protein H8E84_07785 [Flavobacteriales bacterium]|nr:hypothetical protein [Flavobacteriales bacterium]